MPSPYHSHAQPSPVCWQIALGPQLLILTITYLKIHPWFSPISDPSSIFPSPHLPISHPTAQVVLDEAGSMLEPDAIGCLIHGAKALLLVGDHHQLPPFTKWVGAEAEKYNVSLMERLARKKAKNIPSFMLKEQYVGRVCRSLCDLFLLASFHPVFLGSCNSPFIFAILGFPRSCAFSAAAACRVRPNQHRTHDLPGYCRPSDSAVTQQHRH